MAEKSNLQSLPAAQQDYSGIIVQLNGVGVRTVTDAAGNFDFFVNPGTYDVSFSAPNYMPTSRAGVVLSPSVVTNIPALRVRIRRASPESPSRAGPP